MADVHDDNSKWHLDELLEYRSPLRIVEQYLPNAGCQIHPLAKVVPCCGHTACSGLPGMWKSVRRLTCYSEPVLHMHQTRHTTDYKVLCALGWPSVALDKWNACMSKRSVAPTAPAHWRLEIAVSCRQQAG